MPDKLSWGVMGNATIARVCVIPAIQASRNGVVRALASRSPDRATKLAQKHHIGQVYSDYQALVDDPRIEAVYIPLPNHLHCEWTLKSLAAGKHVLCEKPLACNALQAKQMATAAQTNRRFLMEGFMYRFHPRNRKVHMLVGSNRIGPPRLIRSAFCYRMQERDALSSANARLKPEMGGGALLDVGCYCVSVARWFYNAEPRKVQCLAHYHPAGVDTHVAAVLQFDDHRLATLEASFIAGLQQTYTVVGENGVIDLPQDAFIPWTKATRFTLREAGVESAAPTTVPGADEYQLMVEHFVDAARGDTDPLFTPSDSVGNMLVLDALAEAARSGQPVDL